MVHERLGQVMGEAAGDGDVALGEEMVGFGGSEGLHGQRRESPARTDLPFKSEYAQWDSVGFGGRQRLGEKVNARLSQVA